MFKKLTRYILLSCIILTFTGLILTGCGKNKVEDDSTSSESKVKVVVTFNAMREFVAAIGKDKVEIVTIIPDGTEPHDFEPKAKDLENLNNAKVFVYNGFSMEAWVDKSLESVDNKSLVSVEASKGYDAIENTDEEEISEHGQYDPHVWISLKGAEYQAGNIKDALVEVDPSNKDYYEDNYKDFVSQLDKIYDEYTDKFQTLSNKSFVTGHAAFAYLCRDFGLKQNSVEDVFAEGEPSAKKLKELTDYCKENKITTIFVEDMVSPKISETIASEVGAKVEKIHTIESKDEDNKDYIHCMKENLDMIYNSLK